MADPATMTHPDSPTICMMMPTGSSAKVQKSMALVVM